MIHPRLVLGAVVPPPPSKLPLMDPPPIPAPPQGLRPTVNADREGEGLQLTANTY